MRIIGVLAAVLVLAGLAATLVRGVRRTARPHDVEDAARSTARAVVAGLIVLAALILVVVVVVTLLD